MKRTALLIISCFLGMLTFLHGQTLNYPPSCVVTSPHNNAYFKAGTDVEIHVYATDIGKSANNGTVTKVEFFNETTLLGEATTNSNYTYKFVWACVPAGTYTIKAKATNNNGVSFTSVGVVITVGTNNVTQKGMSACKGKYLANVIPGAPQINYNTYWNGVTAENNCKWGPVESTRDVFNWSGADVCYNHAKDNNMLFRYHALIWASQYPTWFTSLSSADARAEALEYITAVAQRFPFADQVDVINEQLPGHQADNPTFATLLGGTGSTGYDWQIWVFTQARSLFPNTKLILNDYGLENDQNAINNMLGLVKALRDRGLIDGFGTQAHCFNVDQTSATQLKSSLDLMATGGIPVYVTELDLNGGLESESNEAQQSTSYQTHFPVYWDHPTVSGITLWGYISGATWKTGTGLMSSTGTEKSALTWMKGYVTGKPSVGYPSCATAGCNGISPTVSITSPANNATYATGANITITANASDADGSVTKVEFYNGTTKLGEDATSPYSYTWNNVAEGTYSITAVATDNSGNKTTSDEVIIMVGNPRTPLITNGEFDQGTSGWDIQNNSGANGTMTVVTNGNLSGTNSLKICPVTPGTADWHVQVRQNVPLISGKNYHISFMAKADAARTMTVSLQQEGGSYVTYFSQQINLTTSNQTFTFDFNATVSDATAKLKFYVGGNSTCVLIDKVEVSEANVQLSATLNATGATTFCSGSNVVLNANTGSGYTYEWRREGNVISGAAAASYTASQSGSYTVVITANSQTATSNAVVVTVNTIPAAPGVNSPLSYCQNMAAVALTATGTSLQWYTVSSGGTASAAAPTPVTAATGTTSYYVSQTTNGCESARATIAVTVYAIPSAAGVSTPVSYCQNATATALTATGTALKWYTVPTNGTSSSTLTPSTTSTGTTSYYVSQTTNGCESARATIAVTVNAVPSAPGVAPLVTYCQNVTATALTSTGTALLWYTAPTSGTGSATAPIPSTTATGTTSYYVSQTTNGCESARSTIAVTVNAVPSSPGVSTPVTYCQNAIASALTATGTNLQWYTVSSSGTGSATAPTPSTVTVGTTSYYVSQTTSGCESARATIGVVVNSIPTASITAGGPTTFIQGGSVLLSANTGTGLTYRWLNGPAQVGTGSTYTATTGGSYTVEVTNTSTCKATSSATVVTVNGNQPPTVAITAPANNATFMEPAGMTISATANDADGSISKVDFYYGTTFIGSDNSAPYSFAWTNVMAGTYSLTAVATDDLNTSTTSSAITVIVTANQAPAISITSPLNNATFTSIANVTITASATDADGTITKVEFYHGSTLLGTDLSSPYSFDFTNLSAGTYTITAVATDNQGAVTTSMAINIIVNPNQSSVIDIVSPTNNSTVTGSTVTIDVNATDPDGSITKVEYLDGTTVIDTSTTQPYSFTWNNPTAGTHVITVKVTDSNGGVTTSSPTTVTVSTGTGIISSSYGAFTHVYPNPSLEAFTVKASQGIKSLSVINMYGVEVITLQDLSVDQQVEIGKDLTEGTYVVLIKYNSDKIEVAKLVKIK